MRDIFRIVIIFLLVCAIVFFSYNIYSFTVGKDDNFFTIAFANAKNEKNVIGTLIEDNIKLKDSGITGEKYDFNTTYNPYYGLLNAEEKKLYKQIYANTIDLKDTFVPVVDVKVDKALIVIESVINDHPELFWLGNSFSYKYNNKDICKQITLVFNGTEKDKDIFYKITNEIIRNARQYSTDYEKELYVHDALMDMIEYDDQAAINQSAFSAIVNRKTVCAGYARAFQYIMIRLGIPTYYVTGTSEGDNHAWNIIKLGNGFYNVDVTWDDELRDSHSMFNKTDEEFNEHHTRSKLSSKLVKCSSKTYEYKVVSNVVEQDNTYQQEEIYG